MVGEGQAQKLGWGETEEKSQGPSRAESLKQSNLEKQEVYNGPEIEDEQTGR